jgi:filamentous hemagglutinin
VTQIDIANSLFQQAEIISDLRSANASVDQAMLPWDTFNGIFAGIGGPFAIRQRIAEREMAKTGGTGSPPPSLRRPRQEAGREAYRTN